MDNALNKIKARESTIAIVSAEIERLEGELKVLGVERPLLSGKIDALKSVQEWDKAEVFNLEINTCTRGHHLTESFSSQKVLYHSEEYYKVATDDARLISERAEVFVVTNNWGAAFRDSIDQFDEFNFPFPHCLFEFRVNGKSLIMICFDNDELGLDEHSGKNCIGFVEHAGFWIDLGPDSNSLSYCWQQVMAICIALDAEIATHNLVHAPIALNKKRQKSGKISIKDHHIVNLSRRYRSGSTQFMGNSAQQKRLHFRRGHWRHFDSYKTWIKWCLVGNPDLGFIDKHYSL